MPTLAAFMYRFKSLTSRRRRNLIRRTSWLLGVALAASGLLANHLGTRRVESRSGVTINAAGRGKPLFNFRDGRQMVVSFRGQDLARQALQSGQAAPRALASADLDGNGTPDVVAGYAYAGAGIVTIQRGNPDAFAPADESVFGRLQQGYNP